MVCCGRLARAVGHAVDLLLDVDGQSLDQLVDVDAGPVEDPSAHGIVGDREQDVLGGEVGVASILGSLRRDHKDPFESGGEHDGLNVATTSRLSIGLRDFALAARTCPTVAE